jgi:PAS domain S-box-containing protein
MAGALLVLGGSLVIMGWMFDIPGLKGYLPGWVMMKVNTAACFILSGAALWCLADERAAYRMRLAGRICAAVVAFVALPTLGEHLLDRDFGIDQALMAQPPTAADPASPGRMSAATAFSFLLISTALLGLDLKNRRGHRPALALVLVTAMIGLLIMAGYLYGVKSLYAFSPLISMSPPTALLLFAASLGILCARPDNGPFGILTAEGIGSAMARRILPLAIVLPFLLGWLRLLGERAGFYGFEFGLVLFATSNVVVFAVLVWITAVSLNRGDMERARAEQELRRSEASLANAQRIASMGSWDWDVQADRLLWSEQIYRIFGIDRKDFAGNRQAYMARIHPQDRARVEATLQATLQDGTDFDIEHRVVLPDGAVKTLHVLGDLTRDAKGAPLRLSGTALDITERKRAEEGLLRFRMAMESSLDGIFLMDFETFRYLDANETGCRMLGYTREELLAMRTMDTDPGLTEADQRRRFEEARTLGSDQMVTDPGPRFLRRKDGTTFPVAVARRYLRVGEREIVVGIARDITERVLAEQALQQSEEKYRQMVNLSPDAVTIHQDGRWVFANPAAARLLGVGTPAQLVGRSLLDFMDPDIHEQVRTRWKQLYDAKQAVEPAELKMTRPDGSVVYLETQAAPIAWEGRPAAQVVARDVTERKRAEEEIRRLNADLERRVAARTAELHAKNKELETFSYSVSHDLKAPLRGIDGYSRLLQMDYESRLDEEGRVFLRNIRSAASQMQQLIDDLLAYSKLEQRSVYANRIDLKTQVDAILKERAHDLERVRLSVDVSPEPVWADREGLSIVLRNLIDNAVKFSRKREPPVIEIRSRIEGGRHILSVRDNGTGFDMKYHDRIFQIFQRLHRAEDFSGTGVGLAIVLKAAERMGGRVWAESEPDKGATFYLDLPRDGNAVAEAATDNALHKD